MASNSIGSAALILNSNAAQLVGNLQQAAAAITRVATVAEQRFSAMQAAMDRTRRATETLATGLKVLTVAGLAKLGLDSLASSLSTVEDAMNAIDVSAKASRAIGIRTETYMGLQHAAGLSGVALTQLDAALRHLVDTTASARSGTSSAVQAFARLGITADSLAGQSLDTVLDRVADGIAGIQDPVERTTAAMEFFGSRNIQMITLVEGGSEAIRNMVADAENLGVAFNAVEALRVEDATTALGRMRQSMRGLVNQLAVGLAPAVTQISNQLTRLIPLLRPVFRWIAEFAGVAGEALARLAGQLIDVTSAVERVSALGTQGVATLTAEMAVDTTPAQQAIAALSGQPLALVAAADLTQPTQAVDQMREGMTDFRTQAIDAWQGILTALARFGQEVVSIGRMIAREVIAPLLDGIAAARGWTQFGGQVLGAAVSQTGGVQAGNFVANSFGGSNAQSAATAAANIRAATEGPLPDFQSGITQFFDQLRQQTAAPRPPTQALDPRRQAFLEALGEEQEKLREQIQTFGVADDALRLWRLSQQRAADGTRLATDAQLAQVDALQAQVRGLQQYQDAVRDAASVAEQNRTSAERFRDEYEQIQRLRERGLLSNGLFERARRRLLADAEGEVKFAAGTQANTTAGVEALLRFRAAPETRQSEEQRTQRLLEAGNTTARQQLEELRRLREDRREVRPVETI